MMPPRAIAAAQTVNVHAFQAGILSLEGNAFEGKNALASTW